jgi:hypothetical protein
MRRVIRKRIRHQEDGLDLAVDFNADVAVNVGRSRPVEPRPAAEEDRTAKDPARPQSSEQEGKQP